MSCLHHEIVIAWNEERGGELNHESWCSSCGQTFEVLWVDHGEPSEETGWKWGALRGIEMYTQAGLYPEEEA